MTEVLRIFRNIFFPKIPPILKLKVGFFQFIFFPAFFFEIGANLSYLNFISVNLKKNRRTFFFVKTPDFQLEVGIFSDTKHFSNIFQIGANLSYLNFISVNLKKKSENLLRAVGRSGGHYHSLRSRLSGEGRRS